MSGDLKFFYDAVSQPCRAVMTLMEVEKIQYQACLVAIAKGETNSNEDFVAANPGKTLPAMDDGGFKLFESVAIMKYLITKYQLPDHWYPCDLQKRAKIEEYLNWHWTWIRKGAAGYMYYKFLLPQFSKGVEPNEATAEERMQTLEKGLKFMDTYFLKDTKFINSNEISIADLQAACELTQFWMADIDILQDKPNLKKWFDNVQSELNPVFFKVHEVVNLIRSQGIHEFISIDRSQEVFKA